MRLAVVSDIQVSFVKAGRVEILVVRSQDIHDLVTCLRVALEVWLDKHQVGAQLEGDEAGPAATQLVASIYCPYQQASPPLKQNGSTHPVEARLAGATIIYQGMTVAMSSDSPQNCATLQGH